MKIIGYYCKRGTFGIYILKNNGEVIAPFIQFTLTDMWLMPSINGHKSHHKSFIAGWLFFYFGNLYIGGAYGK